MAQLSATPRFDLPPRSLPGRSETLALEERFRFETLLAEVSAGLSHVPAVEIDMAITRSLAQVGTLLGVDRGTVDVYAEAGRGVRLWWALPGLPEAPGVLDTDEFPWTTEQLRRGDIVRFFRPDELPEEAAIDRASFERGGTRSSVALPLSSGGPVLGVLCFASVRRERAWPTDLVEWLRLLSEVFASTLERKRVEVSLTERLRFETLLASLSARLNRAAAGDLDGEVQRALERVVDFLGVARGRLIEFSRDGGIAHSWTLENWLEDLGAFPWMTACLQRGEVVGFSAIDALPGEAAVDRQSCVGPGIKPQIAIPLITGSAVVGGLVFSTGHAEALGSDERVRMQELQLVAEAFANLLSRKRGEIEARRLRQELAHIGRVSALGELTASLAHELNQPLTAILSNAQAAQRLLAADVIDVAEVRAILSDIVADDKRAAAVIGRLRVLLRKGDLEFVPVDVNEIVTEVACLVRRDMLARDVSMSLELAPGLPGVLGDRGQLQQVVLNLVLNGLEALRPPWAGAHTLTISTAQDRATITVDVRDSGPGLDEKDRDRIFQPLYTTKAGGLGMGLAIARTIVDAHGGRLEATNNVQGGATVGFTVPVKVTEGVQC